MREERTKITISSKNIEKQPTGLNPKITIE